MKIIKEFDYSIRPWTMVLPGLLFAAGAAVLFRAAAANERGLIINGIIKLDAGQATMFFYVLAAASCLFVVAAVAATINGLLVKDKLAIYSDGLAIPFKKETARLYFRDIASAQVLDIYQTRSIEFVTKDNKKYSIAGIKLGSKKELDEVFGLISGGIKNGQV